MKEKGLLILEAIKKIQEKRREQDILLRKLYSQAQLMCQEIDPQEVKRMEKQGQDGKYRWAEMKDGRKIRLEPPIEYSI